MISWVPVEEGFRGIKRAKRTSRWNLRVLQSRVPRQRIKIHDVRVVGILHPSRLCAAAGLVNNQSYARVKRATAIQGQHGSYKSEKTVLNS